MAPPSAATRRKLQRKFRLRGFTLKVDALEEAAAFLERFPDAEDEALDLLLDELDKEPRKPCFSLRFSSCLLFSFCGRSFDARWLRAPVRGARSSVVDTGSGRGPARGGAARRGGGSGRRGVAGGHQRQVRAAGGGRVPRAAVPLRHNQESVLRVCERRLFSLVDLGNSLR